MPLSFHATHLQDQRDASYALGNDKAIIYPEWWEVDKMFIPVMERGHWILIELQLPSLKTIIYDSILNYISLSALKDIICRGWTDLLSKYLYVIDYWTNSGNEKPNKLKVIIMRDETTPQQASIARGGGRRVEISIYDIVVGDVVPLNISDHVPADGILISGHSLALDESSMTGESDIVHKDAKRPFLMSGCKVADGSGTMLVIFALKVLSMT
ncbi:hypothetical protein F3Y22_tig00116962pilonHSYRG00023 [Hibiscus syriacus]|uniref:P-type ATPase A domain-containing protein n=1 Tax=Hibiscus syriacus TaxID=106335 RepID=A0A6A2WVJ7_HIBSY|nr:hypothetical protein F3Y22_tig00116962pilonHSYRG00023 [Hibiscus syriacus]